RGPSTLGTRGYRAMARKLVRRVAAFHYLLLPILILVATTTAGAQTPGKPKVERLVMGLITPYLDYVRPWINGTADHNIQHDPMQGGCTEVAPAGRDQAGLAGCWAAGPKGGVGGGKAAQGVSVPPRLRGFPRGGRAPPPAAWVYPKFRRPKGPAGRRLSGR